MVDDDQSLVQRAMRGETLTPEQRRQMWLEISPGMTADAFDVLRADQQSRQARAPKVGAPAPDFELDVLDRARQRTGETVRLSALSGTPVALVFGSYT